MDKSIKKILMLFIVFCSVVINSVFAAENNNFYLQVDGKDYSDTDDIKYVSEKGLIDSVSNMDNQKSLSDIGEDLKNVGNTGRLTLMVNFKPNVVINGVVFRQGTSLPRVVDVVRVPEYKFKPIFLEPDDQLDDIKNKLYESATPVNKSEVSGTPRFYFSDISAIYDTFYSRERADVYYQYRKKYLPIKKSVEVYRVNTIPAVVSKDMEYNELVDKIKESINYPEKDKIQISKDDIKGLKTATKAVNIPFSIIDEDNNILYSNTIEVRILDKLEPEENLVELKASTQSGVQSVLPNKNTKLYGSKFDNGSIIYYFKKGDDVSGEVRSDNRYNISSIRVSERYDGVHDTKDRDFNSEKNTSVLSFSLPKVTRNMDLSVNQSKGYLNVYFKPYSPHVGLKPGYEEEYPNMDSISTPPHEYLNDIENRNDIYDVTEYTNQYNNIMKWEDLPVASENKAQTLYWAEYGTGIINIQTEVLDRDYVYVNDDVESIIKNNRELVIANNADLSKTQIIPMLDTSSPSELVDKNNLKGKVKSSTINVTYYADVGNDKNTKGSKTIPLHLKVLNEGNSLNGTTISRGFSDNIAHKTSNGSYIYNKTIQEEIEDKVYGLINGDKIKVYLTELTAKEKSKIDGKAYYIDLGDPSEEHKGLDGFTKPDGNNIPRDSKEIKNLRGEISVKEVVLYEKGKEVIRVTGKESLDKYKLNNDQNLYRFGQYQYTTNDIFPSINYDIGDDLDDVNNRSSIKIYSENVTNNLESVKKYQNISDEEKESWYYDTNKLFIQDGRIGNGPNTVESGKELPNTSYLEQLVFNSLPKVGENYVTKVTVEDITNYNNSCDDNGKNCQKIDFSVPTYDENKESYEDRQLKPPYNIKTKVTVYYDPKVIKNNNVVEKTFDTKIDIAIRDKSTTPKVTNITYLSDAPRVYKNEKPDPNIIKDGIIITIDNKKVDAELEIVSWDSSKVGYSTAEIKIKYNNEEYSQNINILVVDKININYQPKTISINKEKIDDNVKIYDYSGNNIITSMKNLNSFDSKFSDNFKQVGKFDGYKNFNIIYDNTGAIRPNKENRVVVNDIKFSENSASDVFSNNKVIYPKIIETSIYSKYLNNNNARTVSTGEIKLRLMLSSSRPRDNKTLKEIELDGNTYYLHYQVFDKNGSIGPVMLLNPLDFKDLYAPLNVVSNYKQLFTINFKYNGNSITKYSTSAFSNSPLYEYDIPEEIRNKISKYGINWDIEEKDKVGVVRNGILLNSNPKVVELTEVPVDYKIELVDKYNNPIEVPNVKLSGKVASGTAVQDIVGKVDGYIPIDAEELNKFTNFRFYKNNNTVKVIFRKMPELDIHNFTTDDKIYQDNFNVDKFLMDSKYLIAPKLGSTEIEELVNDKIIKEIKITNTDSNPFRVENKTGKLEIIYFDGQTQEYTFEYNYKIGYKINSNQFVNKTIKVGDRLPSNLSWASDLTGIKKFTVTIEEFVENTPGKYLVAIEVTDLSGESHDVIHKTLTVVENEDEIIPDKPDNPSNPDNDKDTIVRPIQPGDELTPKDNNKDNISELKPGKEITPKDPKDITSEVEVPGEINNKSNGVETGNVESNGGVVNNSSDYIVDNESKTTDNGGIISGGVVSEGVVLDNSKWNFGKSNYHEDSQNIPSYATKSPIAEETSRHEEKSSKTNDYKSMLEESIRYADNIILNSKKYNKSTYIEFLNKYEEIKNLLNSNENITKDKASVLNEELVKSIKGLKSKGFFNKKPTTFVELDLRNPKTEAPIKDTEENVVGTHKLIGEPKLINDRTYLSIRDVANILGMKVNWNNSNRTATFTKDSKIISINIDTKDVFVNGNKQDKLDNDIKLIKDRIYCPLTNISKYFGITNGNINDGADQDIEYYDNGTVRIYIK